MLLACTMAAALAAPCDPVASPELCVVCPANTSSPTGYFPDTLNTTFGCSACGLDEDDSQLTSPPNSTTCWSTSPARCGGDGNETEIDGEGDSADERSRPMMKRDDSNGSLPGHSGYGASAWAHSGNISCGRPVIILPPKARGRVRGGLGIRGNVSVATFNASAFRSAIADMLDVDDDDVTIESVTPLQAPGATLSARRAILEASDGVDVRYSVNADDTDEVTAQLGAVSATNLARSLSTNGMAVSSSDLSVTEAPAVAAASGSARAGCLAMTVLVALALAMA